MRKRCKLTVTEGREVVVRLSELGDVERGRAGVAGVPVVLHDLVAEGNPRRDVQAGRGQVVALTAAQSTLTPSSR